MVKTDYYNYRQHVYLWEPDDPEEDGKPQEHSPGIGLTFQMNPVRVADRDWVWKQPGSIYGIPRNWTYG